MSLTKEKVFKIKNNFKSYFNNSLEKYRCESFFEKEPELVYWIDCFKKKSIFVDIGSNIVLYSIYSTINNKGTTSYSIEPFFDNYKRILENIILNNSKKVIPLYIGLSNKSYLSTLYIPDLRSSSSGGQINKPINEKGSKFKPLKEEKVLVFSLDDLISLKVIQIPNYIKIDVDGNEKNILKGMRRTLSNKNIRSVFIEINNYSKNINFYKNYLSKFDLFPDNKFNNLKNHSSVRRLENNNSECVNTVFSRNN